ncbi:dephospho-CoA kinase [Terrimonas sp.]|uniref:dephospho-CoA kinase n=1 Tax=Terrimonas sp. TaxID=1914338 RepID=UPI000D52125B|nr:dephospho-CoA kinase [Terrimonas sp.]PVD51317.1 dephospho-CoA kinase [Terrimonas sp.]
MLKIGLTGGIGSGKSLVARIFEVLGIAVYYADTAAKAIMNNDEILKAGIIRHFGTESYTNGLLNRKYIASKVFGNEDQLALLNSLVHPATIRDAEKWMLQQSAPYTIKEAALIFESGSQEHLDYVIGVYAPKNLRILRTMQRDNVSRDEVLKRMKNQINEEIKMRLCDFVIYNDEQKAILPQVLALHEQLLTIVKRTLHEPQSHSHTAHI